MSFHQRGPLARILAPFDALLGNRQLTFAMAKRDVLGRYRGASFGLLWSLLSPFLMLIVYTIAFGYILKSRWPGDHGGTFDFALILYIGLIVHGMVAECLTRGPTLMVHNANLVTRVVFPLHLLPWSIVLSALFHMVANTLIFVLLSLLIRGAPHLTILLLPLVWLPLVVLAVALTLVLSAAGVYLRDIGQISGVLTTAMLFLSSAIVPVSTLPESYRTVFYLNPLTFIIDQSREVALFGGLPNFTGLALYLAVALVALFVAHGVFQKARRGFADVL